jgi:hypothetical protein
MKSALARFTTDELIEEIARRRNCRTKALPAQWCDDCGNFKPSDTADDKYNPCSKGHTMAFYLPQSHEDPHTFGFYRRVCADRVPA